MERLTLTQPADQTFYHLDEVEGETCGLVATVWSSNSEPQAYANLFAAAPELLSELKGLVDWLETNQRSIEGEFFMEDLLAEPRAAIAKATGAA